MTAWIIAALAAAYAVLCWKVIMRPTDDGASDDGRRHNFSYSEFGEGGE
ncbi:MAG: hypothetical protein U0746_11810 [Gemmataceae bacterium]